MEIVKPDEMSVLQSIGQELARLGNRLASDETFAKAFLTATIKADRATLSRLLDNTEVKPAGMGSMLRIGLRGQGEPGVKEASYQVRFNVGRFRLFLGVEEE
jgi:hypothetical protein